MSLTTEQKHAVLKGVDISNAEQVFNAVAAAIMASTKAVSHPVAWARSDELDRLADPQITGRACFLSKEKKERCTVALYADASHEQNIGPTKELIATAVRGALDATRNAASLLEDVQFRAGMEAACDEIETRLPIAIPSIAQKDGGKE